MNALKLLTPIAFTAFVLVAFVPTIAPIEKVAWLIGTWENKTSKGSSYETWKKITETAYAGKSYALQGKDTVVFESIQLVQHQDALLYIPTVTNQNKQLPVNFALKSISDNEFVFTNPSHDFPQFISYTKITPDSLVAEISGKVNGKERKQTYPMKKIN